ncbi:hypothetical protein MHYP_G00316780 [Metynnis hypsauchen]
MARDNTLRNEESPKLSSRQTHSFSRSITSGQLRQDRFVLDLLLGESIVGPLGADVGRQAEFTSVHGELTLGHKHFP